MRHEVKYTQKEKFKIWLDLCDFTYKLMQSALSPAELKKKRERMRERHLEENQRVLEVLGGVNK